MILQLIIVTTRLQVTTRLLQNFSEFFVISHIISPNLKMGVSRKQSMSNFPQNEHFLPPDTHERGKKYLFFANLSCFVFLKQPFWDSHFCLITDDLPVYYDPEY